MKHKTVIKFVTLICVALLGVTHANAEGGHDHNTQDAAAGESHGSAVVSESVLNGGRIITIVEPNLEFLVTPERFVQITFVTDEGAMVPVADQVVSAIGGSRSAPTMVEFVEKEGRLISTAALPDMANMPIILQIKATPDAQRVRESFKLNMSNCSGCDNQEYACICGH